MAFVVPEGFGGFILVAGEVVYVPYNVSRLTDGDFVFGSIDESANAIALTIDGVVIGLAATAVRFEDDAAGVGNHSLTVGAGGILRAVAPGGTAIEMRGSGNSLRNWGEISGGTNGADFTGADGLLVANAGTISGQTGAAIAISGVGSVITNDGSLSGLYGIRITQGETADISNAGTIRGRFGIEAGVLTGALVLTNSGTLSGSDGALASGSGNDRVTNTGTVLGEVRLGQGNDIWSGGAGWLDGALYAGGGNDTLRLGDSDDTASGDEGRDILRGRGGEDDLLGGAGNDRLFGGAEDDTLNGGTGTDTLTGGEGDDRLIGGTGSDAFVFAPGSGVDAVAGFTNGADQLDLTGFGFTAFAQVTALARVSAAGLVLDLAGSGGGSVLLEGFALAAFTADDVLI